MGIAGRLASIDGVGVPGAMVSITGGGGVRTVITNPFGYYRFPTLAVGQVYSVSVRSKRFDFDDRSVFVGENVANVDFVATGPAERPKKSD